MITIGIDLSLTGTGICAINDGKIFISKLIKSKREGDTPTLEIERMDGIVDEAIRDVLIYDASGEVCVDLVLLEGISYMSKNTTALSQLSGLSYMVRSRLSLLDIPFVIVAPSTLKKFITGKGNSPKDIMMMEIYKGWGETITNNNIADAFGLAMVGQYLLDPKTKMEQHQKEVINLLKKQII
jgi:crossover junction endodeoxyribonuclease RuvC